MVTRLLNIALVIFVASQFFRCRKQNPLTSLPPVTQDGTNNMAFVVDGQVWRPFEVTGTWSVPSGSVPWQVDYRDTGALAHQLNMFFERSPRDGRGSTLSIRTPDYLFIDSGGLYSTISMPGDKTDSVFIEYEASGPTSLTYYGPQPGSHFMVTRLDTGARIIAGTFDLVLGTLGQPSIELRQGRFDMHYDLH